MHHATYVYESGKPRRKSSFHELLDDDVSATQSSAVERSPSRPAYRRELSKIVELQTPKAPKSDPFDESDSEFDVTVIEKPPILVRSKYSLCSKLSLLAVVLAVAISLLQNTFIVKSGKAAIPVAEGGVIRNRDPLPGSLVRRDDTNTDVCKRWSQQSKLSILGSGNRLTEPQVLL